ncbi:MAG: YicC family protein [Spirochaetales bacterium]|nr:YicC family protein [Spirochaetales bacterium]
MKSMTGYGYSESVGEQFQLAVELKSYNNRYLDINHNIPYMLAPYEMEIDKAIAQVASRGHVEVNIRVKNLASDVELYVDAEAVKNYTQAFATIAALSGKALKPQLSDYLGSEGVLVSLKGNDSERYRHVLFETLEAALVQFSESKTREGESTKRDLVRLGSIVAEGLDVVKSHANALEQMVKDTLLSRFNEMLGDQNYDENRILQEVAVMLVKYSVHEEIKRLGVHLKEYFSLLEKDEPTGKRLDFLCQEMNREINTIGSKSQMVELNIQVVKMKDGLENIREQIRNIE